MAARRVARSSVDWNAFYQTVPSRERELYRALKNRSDYFVNRVLSNPENVVKIDFAKYKAALPGLKMVEEFEQAYSKVSIPYPRDQGNVGAQIKQEEAKTLAESSAKVKRFEQEKVLSAQYLQKLKELPKQDDFTMEMMYDYFPWTRVKGENPKLFPYTKEYQPEHLSLNESKGANWLLSKFGLKIKV